MQPVDAETTSALKERFKAFMLDDELSAGGPLVPADDHVAFARALKELDYRLYVTVCASHWPGTDDEPESFEVATVLRHLTKGTYTWRVKLEAGQQIDTLYELFAGADWQEREQFDLVGVSFANHPDERRLMLPEDWVGHPLRKEYAIDTPHPPWR